ncbi:MAG: hypothetical protein FWF60_06735 [Oscillospiraceae bacterium]|nr:hypothetical protein [Oscillospiraceae bacterium]
MDYIILAALAIALACVIVWLARRKKRCRGGCADCPYQGDCGGKPRERQGGS